MLHRLARFCLLDILIILVLMCSLYQSHQGPPNCRRYLHDNAPGDGVDGQTTRSQKANTPLYQKIFEHRTSELVHIAFVLNIRVRTQNVDS